MTFPSLQACARLVTLSTFLVVFAACSSIPAGRSAVDSLSIDSGALSPEDVTSILATAASPRFLGLFPGFVYDYEIFDASKLQRDLARIERYYRGRGFLEAHARTARVIRAGSAHVRVEIVVDQGPPTLNRRVRVDGLDDLPAAIADAVRSAAATALPTGKRFDEEAYEKAQKAAARALTDRGYAYATAKSDAQADLAEHAIDYTFTVSSGAPAVFGTVTIVGLDPDGIGPAPQVFDEAPLRRAMAIQPGAPYSTAAIETATQALLDLEVMSTVEIIPVLSNPPTNVIPLMVKVEPTKLRALRLGGGVEFDQLKTEIHALFGWEDHNFLGGLRDFNAELKPGVVPYPLNVNRAVVTDWLPEGRLRLQLRQPGVIDPGWTLFVRPELSVFPLLVVPPTGVEPVIGYVEPKGSIGIEGRVGPHFLFSLGYNVQGEIPFPYIPHLGFDTDLPRIVLSFPQLITTLDFRDDTIHTHKGFYAANNLQVAGYIFGGDASDVSVSPEVRGYIPIARGVTFAVRSQLGFLFAGNYGSHLQEAVSSSNMSAIDRDIEILYFRGLFSGGPSSNRGFPLRGIAPHREVPFLNPATASRQVALGCIPPTTDPNCSQPVGGFSQWEASAEVRFDVSGPFGIALFCDAGDVSPNALGTAHALRLDHLHLSCGAGARYDTPVGPIRLDIGYRIQPLQVLGYANEVEANAADPTEGIPPTFFPRTTTSASNMKTNVPGSGIPIALSFGIGESF